MNTYSMMIAGTPADPVIPGAAAPAYAGQYRHVPGQTSSGIRSAGQYCCSPVPKGTEPTMTAPRTIHGMMAVHGMCS
ncbi:MAG: hypothetical protein WC586_01485 [Methanoregula sp.]